MSLRTDIPERSPSPSPSCETLCEHRINPITNNASDDLNDISPPWNDKVEDIPHFNRLKASLVFHGVITVLFTTLWLGSQHLFGGLQPYGANLIHQHTSIASITEAVSYEAVVFNHSLDAVTPFKGPPRPGMDEAWNELLKYSISAVDAGQLSASQKTLSDSSDQSFIMLDVFRSLNCMNRIRKHLYREHYGYEAPDELELNECIDQVRQALMCHLDIALGSYSWKDDYPKPWPNFVIERECRRWEGINSWAMGHHASPVILADVY